MKKIILTLLLLSLFSTSFAQVRTKTDLFHRTAGTQQTISAFTVIDCPLGITIFNFDCKDSRFTELYQSINIFSGTADELCTFINELLAFMEEFNNQGGISSVIGNRLVNTYRDRLVFAIEVYEENGRGYHRFTKRALENAKRALINYCRKNKIPMECK